MVPGLLKGSLIYTDTFQIDSVRRQDDTLVAKVTVFFLYFQSSE